MIKNLLKLGGYALLAKEVADFVISSQHYREQEQSRKQTACVISGSMIGVAVGVGLGLLFAPRAGKETRAILSEAACCQMDRLQCGISEGTKQVSEIISKKKEEIIAGMTAEAEKPAE
jgi:hypothetical protein